MKKVRRKISLMLAIFTLIAVFSSSLSVLSKNMQDSYDDYLGDPYYEISNGLLDGVLDELKDFAPSGNVNLDFLNQALLFHRAILYTSGAVQEYIKNPELIQISNQILDYHIGETREIKLALQDLVNSLKGKPKTNDDVAYIKDYKKILTNMNNELQQITGKEPDETVYIRQEIAILQALNYIAQLELQYSNDKVTNEIAQSIINSTNTSISNLKAL